MLTSIVGRNGSGKTTLLQALACLQPQGGTVTIQGKRPNLGLKYQDADLQLINPTGKEEILYDILLDDLSLGQDIVHKDMLIQLAKALKKLGNIVVMTTHDLSLPVQT